MVCIKCKTPMMFHGGYPVRYYSCLCGGRYYVGHPARTADDVVCSGCGKSLDKRNEHIGLCYDCQQKRDKLCELCHKPIEGDKRANYHGECKERLDKIINVGQQTKLFD